MREYFLDLAAQFTQPRTAIAQILGFIPMLLGYFIFRKTTRKNSLTLKTLADGISALYFLLLEQWPGCIINCINIFRGLCFSQRGRKPWASGIWIPIFFCICTVIGSCLGWTGVISLLPMLGSCFAVIGYWCNNPTLLRRFNLVGVALWLIYGIAIFAIPTVVGNIISLTSIAITELRILREKKENAYD